MLLHRDTITNPMFADNHDDREIDDPFEYVQESHVDLYDLVAGVR